MASNLSRRVTVLGGGAWGTALALHCARKGHEVQLWAREKEVVEGINGEHENVVFFQVNDWNMSYRKLFDTWISQ
jgi:glycerol-3-phosphate dehydrogenase (NAD(P)+)